MQSQIMQTWDTCVPANIFIGIIKGDVGINCSSILCTLNVSLELDPTPQ